MVEEQELPWLYAYQEEGIRLERTVHRPIVPVALRGAETTDGLFALVDSGSCHILAAPWVAFAAGIDDVKDTTREIDLGIGGDTVKVRFHDMHIRLLAPDGNDNHFIEWEAEVGFVDSWRPPWGVLLGQDGFLDRFTVTTSRFALQTSVEEQGVFDARFGVPLAN